MEVKNKKCKNCGNQISEEAILYVGVENQDIMTFCSYKCKWGFQLKEVSTKYQGDSGGSLNV